MCPDASEAPLGGTEGPRRVRVTMARVYQTNTPGSGSVAKPSSLALGPSRVSGAGAWPAEPCDPYPVPTT